MRSTCVEIFSDNQLTFPHAILSGFPPPSLLYSSLSFFENSFSLPRVATTTRATGNYGSSQSASRQLPLRPIKSSRLSSNSTLHPCDSQSQSVKVSGPNPPGTGTPKRGMEGAFFAGAGEAWWGFVLTGHSTPITTEI